ncbi:MAG: 30S ribosomal protein S9 [Fimbriiglobus sp.]
MAEKKKIYLGTGRRKTSVARVRVMDGKGKIEINGRALESYFTEDKDRYAVMGPLVATELASRVDVIVKVHGGGITGQAGAICQGVARAIKTMFSSPSEQKSYTYTKSNVTVVRAFKAEKKAGEEAKPAIPATDDTSIGMIKKIRESGFLTRDSRMKERKKYGLRGARRGTQFSKR